MRYGNDTLSVDVDDAMADPHSTTLCYASSQQTTDLYRQYNTITSDVHSESEAQAVTRGEDAKAGLTEHTHTYTYPFDSPLSGTTRLSWYQTGKTNLYFTETRDSEWQWHQLGRIQVCTLLQTDNHASTPPLCSCRPTNSVKALKARSQVIRIKWGLPKNQLVTDALRIIMNIAHIIGNI